MKKASESFPGGKDENSEVSRRLYRGAAEAARRLEERMHHATSLQDLLGPEVTALRMRLKDYCERLMFSDPVEYGRKAEEFLWRKVYYDVIQNFKQNKKKLQGSIEAEYGLQNHLLAGIGNYHHLLLRLQTEFRLDLEGKIEVPFIWHQRGVKKERWKKYQRSLEVEESVRAWANQACHCILVYLGDLARYIADLGHPESCHPSERYYHQALCINPANGTPHNQLGSITSWGCEAAYHYMRCLLTPHKFDGAEGNLIRVFEKNNQTLKEIQALEDSLDGTFRVARFLTRFLKLCEQFFLSQDEDSQSLCQDTLQDFDKCLLLCTNDSGHNEEEEDDEDQAQNFVYLADDLIFKVVVMSVMCMARLQQKGSSAISAATAFTLALFSHIVCHCVQRLVALLFPTDVNGPLNKENNDTKNILTLPVPSPPTQPVIEENKIVAENKENHLRRSALKKGRRKRRTAPHLKMLRRRRKMSNTSQEDSELSEGELIDQSESDGEDVGGINSDISETGSYSSESLTEHEVDEDGLTDIQSSNPTSTVYSSSSGDILSSISTDTKSSSTSNGLPSGMESVNLHKNCNNSDIRPVNGLHNGNLTDDSVIIEKWVPQTKKRKENNIEINKILQDDQEMSLSASHVLQALSKVRLLSSIKVLADWMRTHIEILSACAESSRFLWSRVVEMLNILLKTEAKILTCDEPFMLKLKALKRCKEGWKQEYPLPEDIALQHLPLLEKSHANLSFDVNKRNVLSVPEQVFLRLQCILSFGTAVVGSSEALITYDSDKGLYRMPASEKININGATSPDDQDTVGRDMESQRKQLMRSMAHLWLKAEVNDLEVLVEGGATPQLSPYLVPDTSALCFHLPLLKQLVGAKRFIIIVPSVVIANLDQLKKESLGAREAIRWLEMELCRRCRYIRAQRQQERLTLLPVKYPRKKEKDAWDYFQILECCRYLNQQQPHRRPTGPLLTLVIGSNNNLPSNATALAQSVGVNTENIEMFVSKWRNSCKNPG